MSFLEDCSGISTNLGFFNCGAARIHGDRTAIIDLSREPPLVLTHEALDRRMNRVASALRAAGLVSGDRVLIALGNRVEFIEAFFGTMRAGLVAVPLNVRLSTEMIRFIINDASCRGAIADGKLSTNLWEGLDSASLDVRLAVDPPGSWDDYETVVAAASLETSPPPPRQADDVAFISYTSGSTGRPKGVRLGHAGLLEAIRSTQQYFPSAVADRALVAAPLYHKNAMRGAIKPKLFVGGSVVLLPSFQPRRYLQALAEWECTYSSGVPAMFKMLLKETDLLGGKRFPKLQGLAIGSSVVPKDLLSAIGASFGTKVKEIYGLTEAGGPLGASLDGRPTPAGSCGVPIPDVTVRLVDDGGADAAEIGELWVRSPSVLLSYQNLPELTRERLIDGFFRTGDLFRKDAAGFYYFMGRTDDLFNCGGENIYPREVEEVLLKHQAVLDVAVAPIPHDIKGQAPAALVVLRPGIPATEEELKLHCLANGPAYAHPRRIFIVDALPLAGPGKIDKRAIRRLIDERLSQAASH